MERWTAALRSDDALAERRVVQDDEDLAADDSRRRKDRRRAEGCKLKRRIARAERAMLLRSVGRLRLVPAALVVTSGHFGVAEAEFIEARDELRDDMSREEARIGEDAAQRQRCSRVPPRS